MEERASKEKDAVRKESPGKVSESQEIQEVLKNIAWDFPVARTPRSQCRGPKFDHWSRNWILHAAIKRILMLQLNPCTANLKKKKKLTPELANLGTVLSLSSEASG